MKNLTSFNLLFFTVIFLFFGCQKEIQKPNIIYILADDLGYGELGVYGQKIIETPHIDALAKDGLQFTQHYSGAPVCAPARCVLLTGQHTGQAYVRGNDEWGERGKVWDYQAMFENANLEGQRPLPDSLLTIAEILKKEGYKTGVIGKWGLGAPNTEGIPNKQGFDFFYGYNCQRQAHTYYPMHLWKNEEKVVLNNKSIAPHTNLSENANPDDTASYKDFNLQDYAPELMQKEALSFISSNPSEPFFLYYASPIPHLPLQAPKHWVQYYQKKLGQEIPYTNGSYFPNQTPKATYAAMISYLDEQVGQLVAKLKETGQYENTLIIFTSDNGPTYTGGANTPFFDSAKPFKTEYGWGKGFTHEGGIRVPMIATWKGTIKENTTTDHISAFHDVMPTICDLIDIQKPTQTNGISFLPTLLAQEQTTQHKYLYWEFPAYGGQQAIRMGKWKAIRKDIFKGNKTLELYNLENDIQEQNNIAAQHPQIIQQIEQYLLEARTEPFLDAFKIEALGDVKQSYIAAKRRGEQLKSKVNTLELQDGYFVISNRTKYSINAKEALNTLQLLQERLKATGGYELKQVQEQKENCIVFLYDTSKKTLEKGAYSLSINKKKIIISAQYDEGFSNGLKALFDLMDTKIKEKKERHLPKWTVVAVNVSN